MTINDREVSEEAILMDNKELYRAKWMRRAYLALTYLMLAIYLGIRGDYSGSPAVIRNILNNAIFKTLFIGIGMVISAIIYVGITFFTLSKCEEKSIFSFPSIDIFNYLRYARPVLYGLGAIIASELLLLIYRLAVR
jgi:hypothetical protein